MRMLAIATLAVALPAVALPAVAQQQPVEYECKVADVEVKTSPQATTAKLEITSNLPDGAVVLVNTRIVRHRLNIQAEDRLTPGMVDTIVNTMKVQISGRKASPAPRIDLGTPGIFEFSFVFDPEKQINADRMKRAMGKREYYRRDFPGHRIVAGEPRDLMKALFDDCTVCAEHIDKCRKLFERIEKESKKANWAESTLDILKEIEEKKKKCMEQAARSLLNATYDYIVAILDDLDRARIYIEQLLKDREAAKKAKEGGGGGGGGGGGSEPNQDEDTHKDAGAADTALSSSADGQRLKLDRLWGFMDRCDKVRIRETLSWCSQFTRMSLAQIDEAYAKVGQGEKAEGFQRVAARADDVADAVRDGLRGMKSPPGQGEVRENRIKWFEELQLIDDVPLDDKDKGLAKTFKTYVSKLQTLATAGAPALAGETKDLRDKQIVPTLDKIDKKIIGGKKE
jgi:hypothetical protein